MAKKLSELKIIWAVDPDTDSRLQTAALSAIKALVKSRRAAIEPVYLLSTVLDSTPSQTFGDTVALTRAALQKKFAKLVARTKLPGLAPLTFLDSTMLSMRRRTMELADYARSRGADVIVLTTHGRKGIQRWFLGSFAESMMLQSDVPLLVVNPHWGRANGFKTILFPTDFSDESKDAYSKVIAFAKISRSRVELFHRISLTLTPELHLMLERRPEYERILAQEIVDCRARAAIWAREAARHGVKVTVSVDAEKKVSVANAILREQKRLGGIIALASRGGDAPQTLMGTTTRAVIHGSVSAVWVLHPPEQRGRLRAAA